MRRRYEYDDYVDLNGSDDSLDYEKGYWSPSEDVGEMDMAEAEECISGERDPSGLRHSSFPLIWKKRRGAVERKQWLYNY